MIARGCNSSNRCTALAVAVTATLAGCTVGPDFKAPADPDTTSYTGTDERVAPGAGEISQRVVIGQKIAENWWSLFRSPVLDGVVKQAIAGNRNLAAARASLAEAHEGIAQAKGGLYPQVAFNAGAARQRENLSSQGFTVPPTVFNTFSVGPVVSFDLDLAGGKRRKVEQQTAIAEAQAQQLDAAYLALTGNALTQIVNIASDLDQIKAVQDIIADDGRNLQLVDTMTRSGELTRIDMETATSQLETDRTLLPPLYQDLAVSRDALALLVGKAPADWKAPDLVLADLTLPQELPVSVPSALVHQRPDILTAEADLHAASAGIGVATAQLYPDITLSGSIGQAALSTASLFSPASMIASIAGQLAAPIFSGGALQAQKRGAEDAFQVALANYEQTVLQSFTQVADVLHALSNDSAEIAAQRRALDASARSLAMMRTTITYGSVTLLQIVDAERQYGQARIGYVRASAQRYQDTIQLFVAMGGGRIPTHAVAKPDVPLPSATSASPR